MADATARPTLRWAAFLGALLILLIPLLITEVPPLLDYPNHLARTYVLASNGSDPVLSKIYTQHWTVIPNLAIDVILTGLIKLFPVYIAGRIMLGLILLLNFSAIILYSRSVFGRWSWWPLAGALMGYHALFLMGFMNFQIGIGFAMLTAAGWNAWRDRYPVLTIALTTLATIGVFFCHIFGVAFCAVLIGSRELVASLQDWHARDRMAVTWRGVAFSAVFLPAAVLYLGTQLNDITGFVSVWTPLSGKLKNLIEPFMNYYGWLDKLTALAILALMAACLWRRMLQIHSASALAGLICLCIYAVAPSTLKEAGFVDVRIPIMLGMLLFAGLMPILPVRQARAVGLALAVLFLVRMAVVATVWVGQNQDIADIRYSIAPVEPGSRVLVATVDISTNPDFWQTHGRRLMIAGFWRTEQHLGSLLTIERHAFLPVIFSSPSQQPLRVLPPYDRLAVPSGEVPDYQLLDPGVMPALNVMRPPYLADWPNTFDYVLLLNADGAGLMPPFVADRLELVNRTSMAALFRVQRTLPKPVM